MNKKVFLIKNIKNKTEFNNISMFFQDNLPDNAAFVVADAFASVAGTVLAALRIAVVGTLLAGSPVGP